MEIPRFSATTANGAPLFFKPHTMTRAQDVVRHVAIGLSGLLLLFIAICYWGRFDRVAAVTIYPPWCWAGVGLLIALLGYSRANHRWFAITCVAWLLFLLGFADSPASLLRGWKAYERPKNSLRVITLNCASDIRAADEVAAWQPDIVLLQESPPRDSLKALAEEFFGPSSQVCWWPDASILARGEVSQQEVPVEFRENFVHARVRNERWMLDVISLRLYPCPVRFDLWSTRCWTVYRENRETRRRQMEKIAKYVKSHLADNPLFLGGDFNAPPGDAVFRLLQPELCDAFPSAGRGWGGTIINELPAIRIDQIWASRSFRAQTAFAVKTVHSDHRMVVADFVLVDP
jgi:vancomycin resistance protein VanJ